MRVVGRVVRLREHGVGLVMTWFIYFIWAHFEFPKLHGLYSQMTNRDKEITKKRSDVIMGIWEWVILG